MGRGPERPGASPFGPVQRLLLAAVLGVTLAAIAASPALGQTPSTGPRLSGGVSGELLKGSRVTFTLHATEPGGWQKLHTLQVTMLLHELILSQMTYFQDFDAITIRGGQLVHLGTDQALDGSFFRVSGLDVDTLTTGDRLDLTIRVQVREDVPQGAQFRLTATDDTGASVSIIKTAVLPKADQGSGFSWGTLAAAVLAALFAGAFLGGVLGSRRRAPTVSVYTAIRRRLDEERTRT
jgi:hypothetical protein